MTITITPQVPRIMVYRERERNVLVKTASRRGVAEREDDIYIYIYIYIYIAIKEGDEKVLVNRGSKREKWFLSRRIIIVNSLY